MLGGTRGVCAGTGAGRAAGARADCRRSASRTSRPSSPRRTASGWSSSRWSPISPGCYGWGCATFTQRALVVQTAIDAVPEAVPDRPARRRDRGHLAVVVRQLLLAQRPRALQRDERRRHRAVGHSRQARRPAALSAARRQGAPRRGLLLPRERPRLQRSRGQRTQGHVDGLPPRARAGRRVRARHLRGRAAAAQKRGGLRQPSRSARPRRARSGSRRATCACCRSCSRTCGRRSATRCSCCTTCTSACS